MVLTKEILIQYGKMEREIKRVEEKLEYYSQLVVPSEHGVVRGSMKEFPYAQKSFVLSGSDVKSDDARQTRLRELLITLQEKRNEFLLFSVEIGIAIEEIDDIDMREMIEDKFVKAMSDEEIARKFNLERSSVTKKFAKFFEEQAQSFT